MLTFKPIRHSDDTMAFRDLLHGVDCDDDTVSVNLEMFDRASASGGKGVVFSDIIESPGHRAALDVLVRDRLCEVFSVTPGELIDVLAWGMANPEPPLVVDSVEAEVLQCKQEPIDLQKIPIPRHYQEDAGRYQSASIIIAEYDGVRNMSYHRQLLRGKRHCVARFVPRHLRTMYEKARANGDEVPIAVVNGADATVLLAAAMSFNEDLDELTVAAALHKKLHGEPLRMVNLPNGIAVPADSEYAMEARITLKLDDEGPYVDITGTVDGVRQEPVIEYDSVYHRTEPVFHALISAGVEHRTLMGMPRAPTIKAAVSEVVNCTDVYLTEGGCGWLSSVVQIKPQHDGDGIKAIHAALDGHRSMKQVVVVDEDIDIANPIRVEWALMTRWQPDTDTIILSGQKGSSLDPSRNEDGSTSKIGMDATLPIGVNRGPFESVL
ncbi:MAG: UbiD family decarboxylase [Candidatus Poseidoniales archaeon]|nr:MAG: UbiD family decarboxylase [Candidatus Poseidoniales archaeon]